MKAHSYADDTQVNVSTGAADVERAVQRFVSCTERIESRMSSNRLKMNADKTQVICIGSRQQLAKVVIKEFQLLSANILFSTTVSYLGVHLDSQLTMQDPVASICRSCFFSAEAAADYPEFIDNRCCQDNNAIIIIIIITILQYSAVQHRMVPYTAYDTIGHSSSQFSDMLCCVAWFFVACNC